MSRCALVLFACQPVLPSAPVAACRRSDGTPVSDCLGLTFPECLLQLLRVPACRSQCDAVSIYVNVNANAYSRLATIERSAGHFLPPPTAFPCLWSNLLLLSLIRSGPIERINERTDGRADRQPTTTTVAGWRCCH